MYLQGSSKPGTFPGLQVLQKARLQMIGWRMSGIPDSKIEKRFG